MAEVQQLFLTCSCLSSWSIGGFFSKVQLFREVFAPQWCHEMVCEGGLLSQLVLAEFF